MSEKGLLSLRPARRYAAGLRSAATLLIGDMATLHDLGSLHALKGLDAAASCPVTMVCVNNGGELRVVW